MAPPLSMRIRGWQSGSVDDRPSRDVDGHVQAAHVEALADAFGLVPDLEGDVTLRVVSEVPPVLAEGRFRSRRI
ncbi:hypothetical protein GS504_02700 [Rhodococcus hoagii]|nr:hypothetical protein [Prescottella equi]NKS56498.1 hypothetical protein [Prescottella equi]NKS64848.1 hypothetical protein [Prescottella equi]NKS70086.1 hypothetical protein [Prescottella equi]NKS72008.1 hypothetical protein [Prescottella equi]